MSVNFLSVGCTSKSTNKINFEDSVNIHENSLKGKLISKLLADIGLDETLTNLHYDADFLRRAKWGLVIPANDNNTIYLAVPDHQK